MLLPKVPNYSKTEFFALKNKKVRQLSVLRIRIRDPVTFWPLDRGSERGKKIKIRIRDEHPWSYLRAQKHLVKILNSFLWIRIRDPGVFGHGIRDGKNSDSGSGINIPDPHHCNYLRYIGTVLSKTFPKVSWLNCTFYATQFDSGGCSDEVFSDPAVLSLPVRVAHVGVAPCPGVHPSIIHASPPVCLSVCLAFFGR